MLLTEQWMTNNAITIDLVPHVMRVRAYAKMIRIDAGPHIAGMDHTRTANIFAI